MIAYGDIDRTPSAKKLFHFALTFLVGAGVLAALLRFGFDRPVAAKWVLVAGAIGFALALVPGVGRLFYIGWMGLGVSIGLVTSPIVLFIVYTVVFLPIALVFRLVGRDAMRRRLDRSAASYWEDYPMPKDPRRFLRQF